jgi:heptosyltransferase-1
VVEANLALAAALGGAPPVFDFPLPPGDPAALPPELPAGELAVINPGAGWQAKQWPADGYASICDALEKQWALPVVLNCGPGEAVLAEEVRRAVRSARTFTFAGSITGLIALLRRARLVIAPDTGPLHMAAALRVPTVALFGPTDPARNGPYGTRSRIFRPENARTSHSRVASGDGLMDRIKPEEVIQAALELLDESKEIFRASRGAATQASSLTSQLH